MGEAHLDYTIYNREERDICAHLFRLLLEDQPNWGPLCQFLGVEAVANPRVYCEVALIRDAYHARKPDSDEFMTELVELVAQQEQVANHTPFQKLPDVIKDPCRTHPKQIRFKLKDEYGELSESDNAVYGAVQGMFNAKPDLVVCTDEGVYIYEAKYTMPFDEEQLRRTCAIGEVWGKLLFPDLGQAGPFEPKVMKLGLDRYGPDISWTQVHSIAESVWGGDDFSVKVFEKAVAVK